MFPNLAQFTIGSGSGCGGQFHPVGSFGCDALFICRPGSCLCAGVRWVARCPVAGRERGVGSRRGGILSGCAPLHSLHLHCILAFCSCFCNQLPNTSRLKTCLGRRGDKIVFSFWFRWFPHMTTVVVGQLKNPGHGIDFRQKKGHLH